MMAQSLSQCKQEDNMNCPSCHTQIKKGSKFCLECGNAIEELKTNCIKCNAIISAGGKFCFECGEKQDQSVGCPKCGAKVKGKFCNECGNEIK